MSTETKAPTPQYWRTAVQLPPAGAGRPTTGLLVAHYAAMAQAHLAAYGEALNRSRLDRDGLRRAVAEHFDPAVAAFTAAAALSGWDSDRIMDAVEDGSTMHECVWEWIDDWVDTWSAYPGTTDALIASLRVGPVTA